MHRTLVLLLGGLLGPPGISWHTEPIPPGPAAPQLSLDLQCGPWLLTQISECQGASREPCGSHSEPSPSPFRIAAPDHRNKNENPESLQREPKTPRSVHVPGQSKTGKDPRQGSIASSSDARGYHGDESG